MHYRVERDTAAFAPHLQAERPDLVHIWGTEFDPAAVMAAAARASGLPVLFSVQGVMRDCAAHLCDGVPEKYRRSGALWHAIDKIIPGELLDNMQASFDALAAKEAAALADARYVTGRTAFDRAACAALAPHARYYPCNETLRPLFYTGTLWHARDFAAAPVLLLPQGNYPLKNLHTVIKALPAVLAEYGDAELRIAGWPPLDKGPLLRPVSDRLFPYTLYCTRLAAQLGGTEHIRYTGPLDAAALRQAYLEAVALLLPSGCEICPFSFGEALLLGLPCVASAVGGIPSMLANGTEGLLYGDALDADALAVTLDAVAEKFGDLLPKMKWLNFGGGHHITRPGYDMATLEKCIRRARNDWGVTVYLEPGEACALNAGYLLTRVLDVVQNGDTTVAI